MTLMAKLEPSMILWKRRVRNTTMSTIKFLTGTTTKSMIVQLLMLLEMWKQMGVMQLVEMN